MEMWTEIRRKVLVEGASKRSIRRDYRVSARTLEKILANAEPPGYRQRITRPKPMLGQFLPVIDEILEADKTAPPKQRHTAKRIYERLRDEYGYTGCSSQEKGRAQIQALLQGGLLPALAPAGTCPVRLRQGNRGDRRARDEGRPGGDDASLLGCLLRLGLSPRDR